MYAKLVQSYMNECHSNAIAIQSASQERSREYFEKGKRSALFKLGDSVVIRAPSRSSKLAPKYRGPYKVVGIKKDILTLEKSSTHKITTRHASDIKFLGRNEQPENDAQEDQ